MVDLLSEVLLHCTGYTVHHSRLYSIAHVVLSTSVLNCCILAMTYNFRAFTTLYSVLAIGVVTHLKFLYTACPTPKCTYNALSQYLLPITQFNLHQIDLGREKWVVFKSYQHFCHLHSQMKARYAQVSNKD